MHGRGLAWRAFDSARGFAACFERAAAKLCGQLFGFGFLSLSHLFEKLSDIEVA